MLLNCGVGGLLRVSWTAMRSNQSILKEIRFTGRTDAEAEYFSHLMQRTDSLEKTLMLGKTEGRKEGDDRG